jgi:hypothetical protein
VLAVVTLAFVAIRRYAAPAVGRHLGMAAALVALSVLLTRLARRVG